MFATRCGFEEVFAKAHELINVDVRDSDTLVVVLQIKFGRNVVREVPECVVVLSCSLKGGMEKNAYAQIKICRFSVNKGGYAHDQDAGSLRAFSQARRYPHRGWSLTLYSPGFPVLAAV